MHWMFIPSLLVKFNEAQLCHSSKIETFWLSVVDESLNSCSSLFKPDPKRPTFVILSLGFLFVPVTFLSDKSRTLADGNRCSTKEHFSHWLGHITVHVTAPVTAPTPPVFNCKEKAMFVQSEAPVHFPSAQNWDWDDASVFRRQNPICIVGFFVFAEQQNSSRTKSIVIRAQEQRRGCSRWRILIGRGKRRSSYQIPWTNIWVWSTIGDLSLNEGSFLVFFLFFVLGVGSFQSLQPKVLLSTWSPCLGTVFFTL